MAVDAAPGTVIVPAANGTGSVLCKWDSPETVTLQPSPPSGSNRIDQIICQARGTDLDSGSNNDFIITATQGTVAASPVAPATPANAVALANVYVGGGVASIVAGNITDVRPGVPTVPASPLVPIYTRSALNATQSIPAGAWTPVGMQTLVYNQGGGSWSGGIFTTPRRAVYAVSGQVTWAPSGTTYTTSQREFIAGLWAGGGFAAGATINPNILTVGVQNWYCNFSVQQLWNAGTTFELRAFQNGPVAYAILANNSWLAIAELPGTV